MTKRVLIQSYTLTPILDPQLQKLDHTRAIFLGAKRSGTCSQQE